MRMQAAVTAATRRAGAKDNLQGAKSEEQLPELRAGADSPDEEIEKGEGYGDGHNCGGAH